MDEELAALEAEFASLQSALNQPTTAEVMESLPFYNPLKVEQAKQQLMFDVPVGIARAGAGLADILSYPVIKGAQLAGVSPETLPTFGASQLVSTLAEKAAPYVGPVGVQPETGTQELISFLSPSPLSKASVAAQAGTGLASYLGMKGAEAVAPESEYAGLVGALAAPAAVSGASKVIGAAAPKLEEAGLGLQRKALGLTKADYKNAKNAVIETVSGDFSTQLKESVDDLIKNKTLGTSLDPGAMFAELQSAKSATEDAIQATLKAAEAKVGPVPPPDFNKTIDYISKNIAADQVDKYVNNVIEFQDALRREGQGSLTYLNQQKKIIGENWKNSPQSDPGFWRTIYGDVKRHIEKYAPEVKDLNKEKQKLILAEPVVTRNFKAAGGEYDIGALQRLLNTTGGAGLAGGAILGAATGSLTGGVASALALRGLATPTGQNIVGRGLRGTASLAEALFKQPARSGYLTKEEFVSQQPYLHGTSEAGLKAIEEAKAFIPKTINYSVLGEGTVYAAPKQSWWFDPEKAAAGRMWELPKQVPVYVKPEANIVKITNQKDWDNLAKRVGMGSNELADRLYYDPTASNATRQQLRSSLTKKKLQDVGVDAIEIADSKRLSSLKTPILKLQSAYYRLYNKIKKPSTFAEAEGIVRIPDNILQKVYDKLTFPSGVFGDEQLAIINPKIAEPAEYAYERLLKNDPSKLMKMTPQELELLPPAIKEQASRLGYFGARGAQQAGKQAPVSPTATPTEDSELAALESEFESLKELLGQAAPQPESIKVGKQDVSIPVGEQYAPPALVKAVMQVESAGKPKAVSEKGAAGLMQLMPGTAKELGVEDRFDPAQNIEGGSRYLQQMINKYKKTDLALAAYNWGPSNIDKAIRKVKAEGKRVTWANIMQVVKVPMETRLYVNKVLKNKEVEA